MSCRSPPIRDAAGDSGLVASSVLGELHPPLLKSIFFGLFVFAIGYRSGPGFFASLSLQTLAQVVWAACGRYSAAHRVLRMNPVIVCGALAGAMTVDAAVTGSCEVAGQTPVLGVAVPYAIDNVVLTVLGSVIVALTFVG